MGEHVSGVRLCMYVNVAARVVHEGSGAVGRTDGREVEPLQHLASNFVVLMDILICTNVRTGYAQPRDKEDT